MGDDNYVSMYKMCENGKNVWDIVWAHFDFMKMFNTFIIMLIIDWMEMTYSVGSWFLECEKEDNVTWALEVCRKLLKDQENISQVIVTNCDPALMSSIAKVFSTSYTLLCRHNITNNMRGKLKFLVVTKQING